MNDFWNGLFVDKEAFYKRFMSFLWRTGWMIAAAVLDFGIQSLADFNLPPYMTVVVGLVLGEISKWVNSTIKVGRAVRNPIYQSEL